MQRRHHARLDRSPRGPATGMGPAVPVASPLSGTMHPHLQSRGPDRKPFHRKALLYVLVVWGGSFAILAALTAIAAVADPQFACAAAGLAVAATTAACVPGNLRHRRSTRRPPAPVDSRHDVKAALRTIIVLDAVTHWWFAAIGGAVATLLITMHG